MNNNMPFLQPISNVQTTDNNYAPHNLSLTEPHQNNRSNSEENQKQVTELSPDLDQAQHILLGLPSTSQTTN
jgi:hypothetical protein